MSWAFQQMLFECQMDLCQRMWKELMKLFCLFFYFIFRALWFKGLYFPSVSQYILLLKVTEDAFSWLVCKLQKARLWLLYPIAYPSSKHELDLNTERQHNQLQIWACMCKQAYPSYALRKHFILFYLCVCVRVWWGTQTITSRTHSKSTLKILGGQGTFALSQ